MDPHETLKVTRTFKEKGNDFFKRGLLHEARRNYTEVLAMLTEQITFTGDDQRKEKETLVLTAHLNLAQCALRLGDDATVIYHCNIALSMDSNNVKAHFRKARAFENRAEFVEALKVYRHVLTLEPDNRTVQNQQNECQEKLDRQQAEEQVSNKMAGQQDQDTEDEDVETVYEKSERDPQTRYKNCTKNPGHKNFINLKDFKIEDLPPDYQTPEIFDHIKYQSEVTVLLKVWPARKFRPKCGPGTSKSNSGNPVPGRRVRPLKHGSGWMAFFQNKKDEQPCPCLMCKDSEFPEKRWTETYIWTAGHVVCNNKEANNTECYFYYDAEEVDLDSCPKLSRAAIYERSKEADVCMLRFISHDDTFAQRLGKTNMSSVYGVQRKYKSPSLVEPEGSFASQCDQVWQRLTELTKKHSQLMKQMIAKLKGDPRVEFVKHRNGRKEKLEDDRFGQLLLDKMRGGTRYQKKIEGLEELDDGFCKGLEVIGKDAALLRELLSRGADCTKYIDLDMYQQSAKCLEKIVAGLGHQLDENVTISPGEFNKDHRLTIIVSHPHGCSKKITIGETTERAVDGEFSQFAYNTPTCPGSSGAKVFVLGQMPLRGGHPHSAQRSAGSLGQLNESGFAPSIW